MSAARSTLGNMSALPAAGWYPDPESAGQERWWNGTAWADDRRPVQVVAPPMPHQQAPMYVVQPVPTRKNGMSIAGLVLALVSLLLNPFAIMSILGIVFGAIGYGRSKELIVNGKMVGNVAGAWAIIIGILSTVLFVIQFQMAMQDLQNAFINF